MSATNPSIKLLRAAAVWAAYAVLAAGAPCLWAQESSVVTNADIERAKHSQPVISDADIERAKRKYRAPTEQELGRIAIPAAPNLDALPQPATTRAIDLEALAKGYALNAGRMATASGLADGPALLIFVSFSMPEPTLRRLIDQAVRSKARLVVRGFVNGSLRDTVARAQRLLGGRQAAFDIDPQAFDRFAVANTPTFVLVRAGAASQPCAAGQCYAPDAYAAASGDVSLDYALDYIGRNAPAFARDAHAFIRKMKD